ncbi:RrF2 family transcriptional regulator [Anaerofustis butyriciformans]|uniref:RrF2 family transcriptional regulator n=1 Tax=Anaerofustis TaxID=264995 RepID=UPI003F88B4EB
MKISTKGRYALRLMIDLAKNYDGKYITLKEVSKRQEISIKYLEQITTQLCRAEYLISVRGPKGGYKLSKEPKNYTVGDILRVTEGSLAPIACLEDEKNSCTRCGACATLEFWKGLYKVIEDYVNSVTLEDLIKNSDENLNYSI